MGEDQPHVLFVAFLIQMLQRVERGGVECRHCAHPQNQRVGVILEHNGRNLIGGAEEQRSADLVHAHVLRHDAQVDAVGVVFGIDVGPAVDRGLVAHPLHKQQSRQHHTDRDRDHQVEHDGQHEGDQQNENVAFRRRFGDANELFPLTHIVRYHKQDGGDGRHRDQPCVRHQEQQHQQQDDRVHHTGHRRFAAVFGVGGGASDGAGCRNTAEQHRGDVADALTDQLGVGVVSGVDHTVRHHAGEQRFNGGQHRDGERIGQHRCNLVKAEIHTGEIHLRQTRRDGVQVADGVHSLLEAGEERDHQRTDQHRHQRRRHTFFQLRIHDEDGEADDADHQRLPRKAADRGNVRLDLFDGFDRLDAVGVGQAEEILDLPDEDGEGDTRGKAGGDGVGDKFNERAKAEHAHQNQQHTGEDGGDKQTVHSLRRDDTRHDGGKRRRRTGNLDAAAAEQRHAEACRNGGVDTAGRGHAGGKRQRDGKRQRNDGDDDAGDQVLGELRERIVLHDREELRLQIKTFQTQHLLFAVNHYNSFYYKCKDHFWVFGVQERSCISSGRMV